MIDEELQKEAIDKLIKCQQNHDTESAHWKADEVLCDLLRKLGYYGVVAIYDLVGKWYS